MMDLLIRSWFFNTKEEPARPSSNKKSSEAVKYPNNLIQAKPSSRNTPKKKKVGGEKETEQQPRIRKHIRKTQLRNEGKEGKGKGREGKDVSLGHLQASGDFIELWCGLQ